MTSKVKGQSRDVTWCIWQVLPISRERKVPEISKLVGRLPILRVILACAPVSRWKGRRSTRETESVSYQRSWKAYELQNWYADGACYQLPRPAIKAYKAGFLHARGCVRIPCRPNPAATQLVIIVMTCLRVVVKKFALTFLLLDRTVRNFPVFYHDI